MPDWLCAQLKEHTSIVPHTGLESRESFFFFCGGTRQPHFLFDDVFSGGFGSGVDGGRGYERVVTTFVNYCTSLGICEKFMFFCSFWFSPQTLKEYH